MNLQLLLTSLLAGDENEVVEFKEANNSYDFERIGKYFSALSNEANLQGKDSAWLIFGISDDKEAVGTNFRMNFKDLNSLKSEIAKQTIDKISFTSINVVTHEGKRVIMLQIPPAPKGIPVSWRGHYYARVDEEISHLDLEELERIRKQHIFEDWSIKICEDATISDLSEEAIDRAREVYKKKNKKIEDEVDTWDNQTFLNKSKLTIRGQITNAAILLLGKPESNHLLSPGTSEISWILKDKDNNSKDYQHFSCPLLLSVSDIYQKIRNLKYRYISGDTLFPEEVDQYDPYIIREALNNCIAHQDYSLGGKIIIVENEDGSLIFKNSGKFIPQSVEKVVSTDSPESHYRNRFLADAMVNLNMIDTIGSGIRKMFLIQKSKFFPLPDYELGQNYVQVTITGKVLDLNYARKLALMPSLGLEDIILLDKIQKHKSLTDKEIKYLKEKKLVEGRRPNVYISSDVAQKTGQKTDYLKLRGFQDNHYKKMILECIEKYGSVTRKEINDLVTGLLPQILTEKQKVHKVNNIVYAMSKRDKTIINEGTKKSPKWIKT